MKKMKKNVMVGMAAMAVCMGLSGCSAEEQKLFRNVMSHLSKAQESNINLDSDGTNFINVIKQRFKDAGLSEKEIKEVVLTIKNGDGWTVPDEIGLTEEMPLTLYGPPSVFDMDKIPEGETTKKEESDSQAVPSPIQGVLPEDVKEQDNEAKTSDEEAKTSEETKADENAKNDPQAVEKESQEEKISQDTEVQVSSEEISAKVLSNKAVLEDDSSKAEEEPAAQADTKDREAEPLTEGTNTEG